MVLKSGILAHQVGAVYSANKITPLKLLARHDKTLHLVAWNALQIAPNNMSEVLPQAFHALSSRSVWHNVSRGKGRVSVANYSLTAQALPDYNPVTLLNTTAKPMPLPALVSD